MGNNNYEIYYQEGLKQQVTVEEASQKLAELLGIPIENALKMIESSNTVIKSELTKDQAVKYYTVLGKVGLQVKIRPMNKSTETEGSLPDQTASNNQPSDDINNKVNYDYALVHRRAFPLTFNGKGFEYFKIWIVNIFLTIITLGIYSAWAKVRNKQYFYGNTEIDGSSFNYTAKPLTILKGRLIAVAIFVLYAVINQFAPLLGLVLFIVLMGFLPWIIIRSLAFNARNSVFRNIHFNFNAGVGQAIRVFLLWPILILPTLGLILPYIWYRQSDFLVENSSYGTTSFNFHAKIKDYYKIFFIFLGILLLLGLVVSVIAVALGFNPNNPASQGVMMAFIGPLSLIGYLFIFAYLVASLGNLYFNSTALNGHRFESTLKAKNIAWIYFSNTVAIVLSVGLLIPWAKVRMARYRIHCLQLLIKDSLDDFIATEEKNVSALGEQVGEVFDMGVSVI